MKINSKQLIAGSLLTLGLSLVGCGPSKPDTDVKNSKPEVPKVEAVPTPDDSAIVETLDSTKGVKVERKGENIVTLDLMNLSPADRESLVEEFAWVTGLPKLEKLIATGPGITNEAVAKLAGHPSLSVLAFENRSLVGNEGIAAIKDLPKLTDVSLERSEITDEALKSLAESKTILRIRIPRTKVGDEGVNYLVNAPQLELLDLLECTGVSDACLPTIGKLSKMRNLRVFGRQITDDGMQHIAKLENLAALGLQYADVSDVGLAKLETLKNLKEINLYGTNISDAGLSSLAKMPKLAKARLRETSIRGENAEAFASMKAMKDLDLSESPVVDAALVHIGKIAGLQKLNLWNTRIGDEGVSSLAGLNDLTELNLDNLLDVTDASMDTIGGFKKLKLLHLGGTSITDDGLSKLYDLKELRTLFLTRTEVSNEAYKALKEKMPWVSKIEY